MDNLVRACFQPPDSPLKNSIQPTPVHPVHRPKPSSKIRMLPSFPKPYNICHIPAQSPQENQNPPKEMFSHNHFNPSDSNYTPILYTVHYTKYVYIIYIKIIYIYIYMYILHIHAYYQHPPVGVSSLLVFIYQKTSGAPTAATAAAAQMSALEPVKPPLGGSLPGLPAGSFPGGFFGGSARLSALFFLCFWEFLQKKQNLMVDF